MGNDIVDLTNYRLRKVKAKPEPVPWHIEVAQWILFQHQQHRRIVALTPYEFQFLIDITFWELPTEKQARWLEAIEARTEAALDHNNIA
jgi:hypothetical protein